MKSELPLGYTRVAGESLSELRQRAGARTGCQFTCRGDLRVDKKGHFIPTELGISVNKWLQEKFGSLINENYTASLESELDKISQGNNDYYHFIKNF